jgi:hypothetical protein
LSYNKIYIKNNKEKIRKTQTIYRLNNSNKIKKIDRSYKKRNKDLIKVKNKKYIEKNREKINKTKRNIDKRRLKEDINYKLRKTISNQIKLALKKIMLNKTKSTLKYLNCTIQELKDHLEKQFEPWMNWTNHGKYMLKTWDDNSSQTWSWQIDHIIPVSSFDLTKEEEIKKCWGLDNLRPLSAKQNIIDGANRTRH